MTSLRKQVPTPPRNSIPTPDGLICGTHRTLLKLVGKKEVQWGCTDCARERTRKWRSIHHSDPEYKAKAIAKRALYYAANQEKILAAKKASYVPRTRALPFPHRMAECHPERKHWGKGMCKQCYDRDYQQRHIAEHNAAATKWTAKHPEYKPMAHRKSRYGIGPEECAKMYVRQNGLCAICRVGPAEHLDHDHKTKQNRALLCGNCNRGLGFFKDNPKLLVAAALYLSAGTVQ